ncbi:MULTISPECIES: pyruvate carboxyltransferase [Pelosinus]|uniref:Pyruvate carboxyltransferase n=1 Tax=Pelosinus fermentans B4 TaxID=1149862 RepID=I9B4H8_9FIRM|nr:MULTISPECIES: pyruvate carboxyltransferase [Pelosinus]EIW20042.1 pyruvate carboxyltransferase [Pelosinus fermentans B4]EIW26103.1 pyruvate carboxyltransferase [Pelosinus fermentans A11]
MRQMVMVSDQTINEALRLGTSMAAIELMIPILKKYGIANFDVSLDYLPSDGVPKQLLLHPLLRCKIHSSLDEIAKVRQMGFSKVILSWFHQPSQSSLDQLTEALTAAQEFAQEIYLCIENAEELTIPELTSYWSLLSRYRVKRFIYQDVRSSLEPLGVCRKLESLQQTVPCPIEFHGHNTYGLATANSLAALRSGVQYVAAAVSGIGSPNHAAMEEVLMAVKHLWKQDQVPSGSSLTADCIEILSYMGISLPVDKALIGRDVFAHESGIHVDGITKNPLLYEVIQPEEVGQTRQLIIGKHSGTASLKIKFLQWNLELDQAETLELLEKVRRLASVQKRPLSDLELHQLYWRRNQMDQSQLG